MTSQRPSFTLLLDWIEGRDTERAAAVAAQVATSGDEVRDEVAWIQGFLADASRMPLEEPPPELSRRLLDAFVGLHRPGDGYAWSDAALLYDSRDPQTAVAVRSGSDGVSLAFDSELGRFVVEVVPAGPAAVDLQGLLRGATPAGGIDLALLEAGTLRRAARVEADGRFDLADVSSSVDELWLTAARTRVPVRLDLGTS